ncbi:hypothetical protein LX36DRAFT_589715 [Colletotrichum falcatum]|nr:hypothetical protein LX36DRAFT_589715 [Colletotrichum falcatum]
MAVPTNAEHRTILQSPTEPDLVGAPMRIQTMAQKLRYNDSMPNEKARREVLGTRTKRPQERVPPLPRTAYDILLLPRNEPLLDHMVFDLLISAHAALVASPHWK